MSLILAKPNKYSDELLKLALAYVLSHGDREYFEPLKNRMAKYESGTPLAKYIHPHELKKLKSIVREMRASQNPA